MKEEKIGYVYLTTNLVNGKQYVGQHLSEVFDTGYKGSGTYIMRAFKKYGWSNFTCEVLQWCSTQTQLNEVEDNCIRLYGTMVPNGYNLKGGGSNGRFSKEARQNLVKGQKRRFEDPEEHKKVSEAQKKRFENPEECKKLSERGKKRFENPEECKKLSEARKKYFENEENRKKQSERCKGRPSWNKGKTGVHSEKTRKEISNTLKKYYSSDSGKETRKQLSELNKGKKKSEKTQKKISNTLEKYYSSDSGKETRKQLSESLKNNPQTSKKVLQYTLDGKFVREWCSLHEIERVLGFNAGLISCCCNGKYKTAYKHLWKFAS